MANIAAGDVSYTLVQQRTLGNSKKHNVVKLVFGDGALTYPSGGIPLTKGKFGLPTIIESLVPFDQGTSGYNFQYDSTNEKLVMIYGGSHTHSLFLNNADVADTANARVNAGTNLLGANTGTDISVAGVADTTGHGGVVNVVGGEGGQPSGIAIAAQTIYVEVIGW